MARDLLSESGSIFVQIGDENVHRVRGVMDEVFGEENLVSELIFSKTVGQTADFIPGISDYCLWYARRREALKYRPLLKLKELGGEGTTGYRFAEIGPFDWRPLTAEEKNGEAAVPSEVRLVAIGDLSSQRQGTEGGEGSAMHFPVEIDGKQYFPSGSRGWSTTEVGIARLRAANRIYPSGQKGVGYVRYLDDFSALPLTNIWTDTVGQSQYGGAKVYVVQTGLRVVERCLLMSTDPGDLVLDPTCGSGTTSYVAEQWGRRWITIDTSRVALALARARIMGARYPYYLLADSREGQIKEARVTRTAPNSQPVHGNIRQGFVYERLPHVTLKSIANNVEIDVIWDKWQAKLEPLRVALNSALKKAWQEWEIPREAEDPWDSKTQEIFYRLKSEKTSGSGDRALKPAEWLRAINHNLKRAYTHETLPERPAYPWPEAPAKLHLDWWQARIARQKEIDASIAARAEFEYLYDKPYEDKKTVRVAGPFTVESLSPHRVLAVDENDEVIDPAEKSAEARDFVSMVLENLKVVQQAHKDDSIAFSSVTPWPGDLVCAERRYQEGGKEKRAAILVGPEFGTVSRPDLVFAAREAGDAGFDTLLACAFNFDAHSSDFNKLGRIPVLKARMNADLHMAADLKNTGKGNLFVLGSSEESVGK